MKKILFLALVVIFVLGMAGVAFAEGYLTPTMGTYDTPHGGYTTSTSRCKICHAVHSPSGTYLLTRSTSNDNVCNVCHRGGAALSDEVVYGGLDTGGAAPGLGLHNVGDVDGVGGATAIPDSTGITLGVAYWGNVSPISLNCKSCHSPHGSDIIGSPVSTNLILRRDPAYNTGEATTISEFCTDCHNRNTKANAGGEPGVINVEHNGATHIMTTATSMSISNFSTWVQVAWSPSDTCRSCHSGGTATVGGTLDSTSATYSWPHETVGLDLLADGYTQTTTLDEVCLGCHVSGGNGVGLTY